MKRLLNAIFALALSLGLASGCSRYTSATKLAAAPNEDYLLIVPIAIDLAINGQGVVANDEWATTIIQEACSRLTNVEPDVLVNLEKAIRDFQRSPTGGTADDTTVEEIGGDTGVVSIDAMAQGDNLKMSITVRVFLPMSVTPNEGALMAINNARATLENGAGVIGRVIIDSLIQIGIPEPAGRPSQGLGTIEV